MQTLTLSTNDYHIVSHGSKWHGDNSADPINVLIQNLKEHPLCPRIASKGVKTQLVFLTTELTEVEKAFSGEAQYIGNFLTLSAGFNLYVKRGSRTEELLDELIRQNTNTFEYQMALGEHNKRTSLKKIGELS